MSERFLFDADSLAVIHQVNRETPCFWMVGDHESRHKKCYTDRIFDTFEEAQADLVRRLSIRLGLAEVIVFAPPAGQDRRWFLSGLLLKDERPVSLYEPVDLQLTCLATGYEVLYPTLRDVPLEDVPCPCGKHYLIKWEEE